MLGTEYEGSAVGRQAVERVLIYKSLDMKLPEHEFFSRAVIADDAEILVDIVSVIGAETLDAEMVLIRYTGEGELDLAGWHLEDEDKNIFIFPQLTLYPEGAVQVHTMAGQDTVVDLYWGLRQSVWESGEEVSLVDPQGTERASYKVP